MYFSAFHWIKTNLFVKCLVILSFKPPYFFIFISQAVYYINVISFRPRSLEDLTKILQLLWLSDTKGDYARTGASNIKHFPAVMSYIFLVFLVDFLLSCPFRIRRKIRVVKMHYKKCWKVLTSFALVSSHSP